MDKIKQILKNKFRAGFKNSIYIIISILVGVTAVYASTTTSLIPPGSASNTMYSLEDIWNLAKGTPADEGTGTIETTPTEVALSGKSLSDVYTALSTEITKLSSSVIASGTTAFGIEGDSNVVDTSSGDASESDIVLGKIAWVDGVEVEGQASAGTNYSLPKTGQTTVYQTGDDGTYQKGFADTRFTDNGDGTITDNATGLEWIKDHNALGAPFNASMTWSNAITNCEGLTYPTSGHDDWRLPNVRELQSIVDYGRYSLSIDPLFTNSQSGYYWSSTTYAGYTAYAWYMSFYNGIVYSGDKTDTVYVRCVR